MRILFVDDALETRLLFSMAFRLEGHSAQLACDGMQALEAVEQERFDAIVMDIEMPRMNGWEATRRIRRTENGSSVPILMFTGYGHEDDQQRAIEAGANGLLRKPIEPRELISHIAGLMPA